MKFFHKKYTWWISAFLIIALLFFASRLVNLTIIPIFTDEAIYLRWAQIALSDPRWRFISLIDGKQPLFIWLMMPVLKYLAGDPLVVGRLVSVMIGFFGLVGLAVFVGYLTKSYKGAMVGAILYLVNPFFLVYDRLALYDALVATTAIWSLFLTYLLSKKLRLDVAFLLGSVIGAGLLTKSSASFFWILLPISLLIVPWQKKLWREQIRKWFALIIVVIIQSQIYNAILRLSEFRHYVGQKNMTFIYSFSEFLRSPFQSVFGNLAALLEWFVNYETLPTVVLLLIAVIWLLRKNFREGIFFLSYFLIPLVALAFFGKVIYPRFILFMTLPLLVILSLFLTDVSRKLNKQMYIVIFLLVFLPSLIFDYWLLVDPIRAPLPINDRQQLINDWPSGYGIKEVVLFLKEESKKEQVIVGTEGTFGLFPMALELYLGQNPNVTFRAYWPVSEVPPELLEDAKTKPTYLIFKERQDVPADWPLQLVSEYQRGDGPTYLRFYRVLPKT